MTRERILAGLRAKVADGRAVIGAGAGTGLSAKCAEAGGVDLIVIYNSGRYRMAGRGSLAGLMPYGDANAIVVEMAPRCCRSSAPRRSSPASAAPTLSARCRCSWPSCSASGSRASRAASTDVLIGVNTWVWTSPLGRRRHPRAGRQGPGDGVRPARAAARDARRLRPAAGARGARGRGPRRLLDPGVSARPRPDPPRCRRRARTPRATSAAPSTPPRSSARGRCPARSTRASAAPGSRPPTSASATWSGSSRRSARSRRTPPTPACGWASSR